LLGAPGAHPELASAGLAAVCAAVVTIAAVVVAVADR
jgi:hypothetical protein